MAHPLSLTGAKDYLATKVFGPNTTYGERQLHLSAGRTGPAKNLYVGTQAEFHVSSVDPQRKHSKLLISRAGAMDSVRL
jgi:hypothetical protein